VIAAALLMVAVMFYGVPLARLFRLRGYTLFGTAYLLGAGSIALHLFALSVLRIPWTRTSVLLSLIPLLAFALWWNRHSALSASPREIRSRRGAEGATSPQDSSAVSPLDFLTALVIASYAVFATWAPPYEWDFYGIWGLKARWFYDLQGMDWRVVQNVSKQDYPSMVPLLFDFVAVMTKQWNDRAFGWVYVGLCAALLAVMRGMLAEEVRWPGLATLAIAFPSLNLWIGLAEGGVMAFGCAGLLFLRRGSLTLGAILLGLSAWCKNEGLALIAVSALALFVATRSIRRVLVLWPAAVVIAPWMITRSVLKLQTDFMGGSPIARVLARLRNPREIIDAFVAAPPDQPWFWLVFLATVVVFARDVIRFELFLAIAVLAQLSLFFGQALATTWDFNAHVSLTLNRLPHQMAPAAGFLAVILLMRAFRPAEA
jgi:hypothetical protein